MDANQLKNNLVKYTGYKCSNTKELKIIENSILNSIVLFFRPVEKDTQKMTTISQNINESLKKEVDIQILKEMNQVSNNYFINELVVSFMSKAHNEWIIAHKEELVSNNMNNPEKFVPFELLTVKDLKKYLGVLIPIFKCLKIEFDEQEVIKAFTINQLIFMIKNEIFSAENLTEKIMNVERLNPEIIDLTSSNGETTMQELYSQKDVANNIAESVKQRVNLNIADRFKEVLNLNDKVGFFLADKGQRIKHIYKFSDNISQKKIGFKKQAFPKIEKPITKSLYKLARFGRVIFAKNVKTSDYRYIDYSNNNYRFIEYQDCSEEQKRAIDRRERKLKRLSNSIDYNGDADTPGIISMVIAKKNPMLDYQETLDMKNKDYQGKTEIIQISITQRELINMEILPEEVGWEKEKKAKIHSSNKVFFAVPSKTLQKKSEFKELLIELSQSQNLKDLQMDRESLIRLYKSTEPGKTNKDENEKL